VDLELVKGNRDDAPEVFVLDVVLGVSGTAVAGVRGVPAVEMGVLVNEGRDL
jgi:hypothetical protein